MKIVHVMQYYMPGHEYHENQLPFQQMKLGHDVWVVASDWASPKFSHSLKFTPGLQHDKGVPIIRLKRMFQIERHGKVALRGLTRQIRTLQPDIIHSHGTWTFPTLQLILSRFTPSKLFVDDHADNANIKLDLINRRIWMWLFRHTLLKIMLLQISQFISVNPFSQWHLQNNLGIPENHISLLLLGVDPEFYHPDPKLRQKVRSQLGITDSELVFLFAGSFDRTKGLETLLPAFACLANQYKSVRLLLIGSGEKDYTDSLLRLTEQLGVSDKVIFQGWVQQDNLCAYYNASDVAIMPGKITASKQAQAVGIPLIVTNEKACEYLITNQNGLAFKKGDADALSELMKRYIDQPQMRIDHGRRSLDLVLQKFSWTRIAKQSIYLYTQLIEEK